MWLCCCVRLWNRIHLLFFLFFFHHHPWIIKSTTACINLQKQLKPVQRVGLGDSVPVLFILLWHEMTLVCFSTCCNCRQALTFLWNSVRRVCTHLTSSAFRWERCNRCRWSCRWSLWTDGFRPCKIVQKKKKRFVAACVSHCSDSSFRQPSCDPHVRCGRTFWWHSGQPLRRKSMQEAELPHGFSEERNNRGKITFPPVYLQLLRERIMRKDTLTYWI